MKLPSGKIMALVAVFAAIGVITGTGAFTTVSAQRTATVSVAGDSNALLGLEPYNGPNGVGGGSVGSSDGYADIQDGTLQINLGGYEDGSPENNGVNLRADTDFKNVFIITNNGENTVNVSISDADPSDNDNIAESQYVTFYNSSYAPISGPGEGGMEGQNVTMSPGSTLVVSIKVDTQKAYADGVSNSALKGNALINGITVTAEATSATADL